MKCAPLAAAYLRASSGGTRLHGTRTRMHIAPLVFGTHTALLTYGMHTSWLSQIKAFAFNMIDQFSVDPCANTDDCHNPAIIRPSHHHQTIRPSYQTPDHHTITDNSPCCTHTHIHILPLFPTTHVF